MKKSVYSILYRDAAILAVNKPPELAVLPGRGRSCCLLDFLKADLALTPLPVHRLDAGTSGIILFALTPEAYKHISTQFHSRRVVKEYLALVRGVPLQESGSINFPIGSDPKNKNRMVIRGQDAKKSRTNWIVEHRFNARGGGGSGGAAVTLLKVLPITERRHQIRVHLKAIGYPLAVDPLYGGETLLLSEFKRHYKLAKYTQERPLIARLTLHAHQLTFQHPTTSEQLVLTAPLPKDFRGTLAALTKWA